MILFTNFADLDDGQKKSLIVLWLCPVNDLLSLRHFGFGCTKAKI